MERINTAVIPEILARIVKELELINRWLDLRMGPENDEAIGKQEEWLNIYELCNMIPGRPRITTLRGWMYSEKIPYYMSGGTPVFRKKEIEAWIPRAMRYVLEAENTGNNSIVQPIVLYIQCRLFHSVFSYQKSVEYLYVFLLTRDIEN